MASLFSIFDFSFSLSLGRNILFGVSLGLGIGVGIGVGMVASKRIFPFRADDRNLVVLFSELTNEIREIRYVMLKLETTFDKGKSEGIRILKEKGSEDEETDDFEEFFEMSVEEPLQSSPEVDDLKAVLDEVDALRSSDNTEDKYKVHGILENSLQKDQQSCDVTWRYARSCFDIATLKGKNGDFEGKRTLLYEGKLHCFFFVAMLSWWKRTAAATLVAEPPTSTLDEALGNFLKAEEIQPGFWLSNLYWIGMVKKYSSGTTETVEVGVIVIGFCCICLVACALVILQLRSNNRRNASSRRQRGTENAGEASQDRTRGALDAEAPPSYDAGRKSDCSVEKVESTAPALQRSAVRIPLKTPATFQVHISYVGATCILFLQAEEIQPGFWLSNLYWIGKCHYEKGNSQIAADYLKKALALPVSSDDDRESYNLSRELLSSLRL
ncbi:PREDICTED: uncharacterized protein LOC107355288 [Acropora digitifera]|uniref:uncharacterized protein LOC107355288 n=1 Tax=Acropora digitifera TaxID=70779 RepID=UPI00077A5652|nr:PREDICTED: uncharacterized protein LOC107355288 [Acropora digitifera]